MAWDRGMSLMKVVRHYPDGLMGRVPRVSSLGLQSGFARKKSGCGLPSEALGSPLCSGFQIKVCSRGASGQRPWHRGRLSGRLSFLCPLALRLL